MVNSWDRIINDWDKITNPDEISFVPKLKPKRIARSRYSYRKRLADVRYNTVDNGGAFISPMEELNYNFNQNIYGETIR